MAGPGEAGVGTAKPGSPKDRTAEPVCVPGAPNFYFWQAMGLDNGNHLQEAGWMIAGLAGLLRWKNPPTSKKMDSNDLQAKNKVCTSGWDFS